MALLESVPNVSEGCDPAVIEAVAGAFAGRARVLDIHSDPEHHRSVYTIVAEEDELAAALFAGIARAAELIDLRSTSGSTRGSAPRTSCRSCRSRAAQMPRARGVALELGERVGAELGLPVFLYGESADGVRPGVLPAGWAGGAAAAHRQRRAAAVVRPSAARPACRWGAASGRGRC